ncbi:MAG: hypothetical protein AAFY17_16040 [Cyanobacteria bacterium J06642_11]
MTACRYRLCPQRFLLWLVLPALTTGCLPTHKQLQPAATAIILDQNNTPIERAQVSLITSALPSGTETSLKLKFTDSQGVVTFDAEQEWTMAVPLIQSGDILFWNWCIYTPGYETYRTDFSSAGEWPEIFTVNLTPGVAAECHDVLPDPIVQDSFE